jgi:hypothetical protein
MSPTPSKDDIGIQRRPRQMRWLTIAAALVILPIAVCADVTSHSVISLLAAGAIQVAAIFLGYLYGRWRRILSAINQGLKPPLDSPATEKLKVAEEPARLKINVKSLGTAAGTVPPDRPRHLITTFGILGSVVLGIGGVVLTLCIAPQLGGLALAELVLALAAAVLIAACDRHQSDRRNARMTEGENMLSSGPSTYHGR